MSLVGFGLFCPFCNVNAEHVDHLFLMCPFDNEVWTKIYAWIGVYSALPSTCRDLSL